VNNCPRYQTLANVINICIFTVDEKRDEVLPALEASSRVARWFIFKTKIPTLVNLGGPEIGKC
jgi:hypothetical protein